MSSIPIPLRLRLRRRQGWMFPWSLLREPLLPCLLRFLLYLLQNKGKTLTREKILAQVWDVNGNYVNDNTLTVTVKRLRDKLHQPACLKTVRSVGYRMEDTL